MTFKIVRQSKHSQKLGGGCGSGVALKMSARKQKEYGQAGPIELWVM